MILEGREGETHPTCPHPGRCLRRGSADLVEDEEGVVADGLEVPVVKPTVLARRGPKTLGAVDIQDQPPPERGGARCCSRSVSRFESP
jgi:hypothetical protein